MTTETTAETPKAGKRKKAQKRICGFCHESGHNVRTCPKKKASEGPILSRTATPSSPPTHVAARDLLVEVNVETAPMPVEFEETVKQVHLNGTTFRLAMRDHDGTNTLFLRAQPQRGEPKDIPLDTETATKLYELLGWGLQRQVARARAVPALKPAARGANGVVETR